MSKIKTDLLDKKIFQELITWSRKNYSDLPWRVERSAYSRWISEVMLQQTTVPTVLKRFPAFMKRFPTIRSVADASEEEVLKHWQGLGYYRRARNIHKGCQQLESFDYKLPDDYKSLVSISGIGEYTANAILSFAFKQTALPIDVNVHRVLSRYYAIEKINSHKIEAEIDRFKISMGDFAEALMDCGRIYCQKKEAECLLCPLAKGCQAFKQGVVDNFPLLKEIKKKKNKLILHRLLVLKRNEVMLIKREKGKWLEGQWELPTFIYESEESLDQYPIKKYRGEELLRVNSTITHHNIENVVIKSRVQVSGGRWVTFDELNSYHLSSVTVKILKKINLL